MLSEGTTLRVRATDTRHVTADRPTVLLSSVLVSVPCQTVLLVGTAVYLFSSADVSLLSLILVASGKHHSLVCLGFMCNDPSSSLLLLLYPQLLCLRTPPPHRPARPAPKEREHQRWKYRKTSRKHRDYIQKIN